MLAFSNDYYGFIFRATQSVELFCAYFVSVSSVSASKTPPTDTSTEENAPETESSEEIFHLPAILFFHCSKKQGFICRKDSKTVKTVVIILRKQK